DPTLTLRLASGDALVLGGAARLAFHGVDRIIPGTSTLLPEGGRINLTLRRVGPRARGHPSTAASNPPPPPLGSWGGATRPTPGTSNGSSITLAPPALPFASRASTSSTAI